jgi:hypothetical protein
VYVRKGPPPLLLRLLGPGVVLTTALVFVSGVVLLFAGPSSRDTWFPVHKLSFIAWLAFTGVHVLGHLPACPSRCAATTRPARATRAISPVETGG